MCPACMSNLAMIAVGSTGGLLAAVVAGVRVKSAATLATRAETATAGANEAASERSDAR